MKYQFFRKGKTLITQKPINFLTQIFFLGSFPDLNYPLPLKNHSKFLKRLRYHILLRFVYQNAKTLITRKLINFLTQIFFLGSFPDLNYPLPLKNHSKFLKRLRYLVSLRFVYQKRKNAHNSKTIQLFDPIFFPVVISPS